MKLTKCIRLLCEEYSNAKNKTWSGKDFTFYMAECLKNGFFANSFKRSFYKMDVVIFKFYEEGFII